MVTMDNVVAKMQPLDSTITEMAGRIDAYVNRVDGMMTTIESNDLNVKGAFDTKWEKCLRT